VVLTQIDRLIADIGTPEKACPNCGYVDPARLELRETWQKTLEAAQEKAHGLAQDIEEKRRALEAIEAESTEPPAKPSVPAFDGARMRALRAAVDAVDVAKIRATLDRAQTATVRIAELKQIEQGSRAQADHATALAEGLREQLDGTLDSRAAKAQAAVDEARKEYVAASQVCAALRSQLDLHRQRIAELEQQQAEIEIQRQAIACRKTEAAEWAYLHKACGPDGIQALELDALGPSIAEVANRLLASSYGPRFSIEFSTTRIAGRGSSVRQIEDFQIHITDNENGSQQEISTLSGGESIWIKNALYMAFGVIRERNTGMKLLTAFIDEMDGALDPDSRMKYFAMLQVAHHESGRRNTIVITHSEAAQEAIPQKIIMRDFAEVRDVA